MTSCKDCGKILNIRKCPECQGVGEVQGQSGSASKRGVLCTQCKKPYELSPAVECPICHKKSRIRAGTTIYLKDDQDQAYYCFACKCSFHKTYPRYGGESPTYPLAQITKPPPAPTSSTMGATTTPIPKPSTTVPIITSNYTGKRRDPITGHCPKCRTGVKVYSKSGGWCTTCKKYVFPYTRKTHPFLFEGTI